MHIIGQTHTLQSLALHFHMDWDLTGDPFEHAERQMGSFDASEKQKICLSIEAFLAENASDDALLRAWIDLGASGWPMANDLREYLTSVLERHRK